MSNAEKPQAPHVPVLLEAALEYLAVHPEGTYVDCTAGAGGHAEAIARKLNQGRLLALDRDATAVAMATTRLQPYPHAQVVQTDYRHLAEVATAHALGPVDGILIDAGLSSMQLDTASRGVSFQANGPLDMRMDPTTGEPASALLASMAEADIATLLRTYGDIRLAGRIARVIRERAGEGRLDTTEDLAAAVSEALNLGGRQAEETRAVFQAVRIAVNDELRGLEIALDQAVHLLGLGGRLVVITFHSGEDRVAKQCLRRWSRPYRELHPDGRVKHTHPPIVEVLTPRPVLPTSAEQRSNPRSKSAKLRACVRISRPTGAPKS